MNAFLAQQAGHLKIRLFAEIVLGRAQDDIHPLEMLALRIGQILGRVVEIHVVVVVTVHKLADVKGRSHREKVRYLTGVAKREIQGLVAPKAASGYANLVDVAFLLQHGHEFLAQKLVVKNVILYAHGRGQMLGIPGILVDAVDAVQFHASGFNERAGRFDELEIAGFVFPAAGGGENEYRIPPGTENQHVDVLAEMVRVKAAMLFLHDDGKRVKRQHLLKRQGKLIKKSGTVPGSAK